MLATYLKRGCSNALKDSQPSAARAIRLLRASHHQQMVQEQAGSKSSLVSFALRTKTS